MAPIGVAKCELCPNSLSIGGSILLASSSFTHINIIAPSILFIACPTSTDGHSGLSAHPGRRSWAFTHDRLVNCPGAQSI